MLATSSGTAAVISGPDQPVEVQVLMTLPGGVYPDLTLAVDALHIEGDTTTDLPDQSRLQVGYPAMSATFTVSGLVDPTNETRNAAWLFGKYSTTSPLYRQFVEMSPVTIKLGYYPPGCAGVPEFLTKFTGYVDSYTQGSDGSVEFTCIDKMTLLRSVPELPPVVTTYPFSAGLTSEYAVDALLRAATNGALSSWPQIRPQCILAVGMRASIWPALGTLNTTTPYATSPVFSYVNGASAFSTPYYSAAYNVSLEQAGGPLFFEWWHTDTTGGFSVIDLVGGNAEYIRIIRLHNSFQIYFVPASGSFTYTYTSPTFTATDSYTSVLLTPPSIGAAGFTAVLTIGAETHTGTGTFDNNRAATYYTIVRAGTFNATLSALQVTTENAPASNAGFVPAIALDPSLNTLQIIPEIEQSTSADIGSGTTPADVLQQIADAELAFAGFDESGVFRFVNRHNIANRGSVRDVTSGTSIEDLEIDADSASVVNRAQVGWTGYTFATTLTTQWAAANVYRVPAHGTTTINVTLETLTTSLDSTFSVLGNGVSYSGGSYYRASADRQGLNPFVGTLTFALQQTTGVDFTITVTNPTGQNAYLCTPATYTDLTAGSPALWLAGLTVTQQDEVTEDYQFPPVSLGGAAGTRWGEVAWTQSGNPWIQDQASANQLASDVVADGAVPRPNLSNVSIIPDPRLQLLDVVHLLDPDETSVDEYARIFSWSIDWEGGDNATYDMTIDARTIAAPGGWIGGVAGRSEGGVTTWGY